MGRRPCNARGCANPWGDAVSEKKEIDRLAKQIPGLRNDARYWDLRRTYGDYSREVLLHLRACAAALK